MSTFHHYGVPTNVEQDGETYIEGAKVFVTDAETHPYRVEFLRFEEGSPMHEDVINNPHAAFMVSDIEIATKGKNVIVEPFDATESLRVAFINDNGAVIELMQNI